MSLGKYRLFPAAFEDCVGNHQLATDRNAVMDGGNRNIVRLSPAQRKWLERGLTQPGGKLPLFDGDGRKISPQVVKKCVDEGWAEPWFANQLKPDWMVCKLTSAGRSALEQSERSA
jgi:hypothetical protein